MPKSQQREAIIEKKLNNHRKDFIAYRRGIQRSLKILNKFINDYQEELPPITILLLQNMEEKGEQLVEFAKQMINEVDDIQIDDLSNDEDIEENIYQEFEQAKDRIENSDFPEKKELEEIISTFKTKSRNTGLFKRSNTLSNLDEEKTAGKIEPPSRKRTSSI